MSGHDAFFSYSHADNAAHGGFIRDFRAMLKKRVAARLKIAYPSLQFIDQKLDFFIDHEGLPAGGDVSDALKEHVLKSEFLFILVGKGYLQSAFCQHERGWFRAAFHENEDTALERTFLIFMTSEALTQASEGDLGRLRSRVLWKDTCGDKPDSPIRPRLRDSEHVLYDNPDLADVLDVLAKSYVDRYQTAVAQPVIGSPLIADIRGIPQQRVKIGGDKTDEARGEATDAHWNVAIGAVTSGLKAYRDELKKILQADQRLKVQLVELKDLVDERDEIKKRLADVDAFVQVFDFSAVRAERDDPPGGHLEVQRQLLPPDAGMLFWMPPGADAANASRENDPKHLEFIRTLAATAGTGDQGEAANALLRLLNRIEPKQTYAQVIVECNTIDRADVHSAFRLVDQIWQREIGKDVKLVVATVPFKRLVSEPNGLDSLDGIVVVDRSQQYRGLFDQVIKIQERLDQSNSEVAQQIFVLPPQDEPAAPLNWPVVVFRGGAGTLEITQEDDVELRKFLKRVRERARRSVLPPAAE